MNTIAAYAQDMNQFLQESELTERRAFIESFVKEIVVMVGGSGLEPLTSCVSSKYSNQLS